MTDFLGMLHRLRIQLVLERFDPQLSILQFHFELDFFKVATFSAIPSPVDLETPLEVVNSTLHLTHALLRLIVLRQDKLRIDLQLVSHFQGIHVLTLVRLLVAHHLFQEAFQLADHCFLLFAGVFVEHYFFRFLRESR